MTFVCFLLHAANIGLVAFYIVKRDKPQKIVQYQQNKELDMTREKYQIFVFNESARFRNEYDRLRTHGDIKEIVSTATHGDKE